MHAVECRSISILISCLLFINVVGVLKLSLLIRGVFFHQVINVLRGDLAQNQSNFFQIQGLGQESARTSVKFFVVKSQA